MTLQLVSDFPVALPEKLGGRNRHLRAFCYFFSAQVTGSWKK
jgi:hypothetical protein